MDGCQAPTKKSDYFTCDSYDLKVYLHTLKILALVLESPATAETHTAEPLKTVMTSSGGDRPGTQGIVHATSPPEEVRIEVGECLCVVCA